jgi:methylmalonyl-CoA/ethylmalonyl-CoA epimerase
VTKQSETRPDPAASISAGVFQVAIVVRDLDQAMETMTRTLGAGPFQMLDSSTRKVFRGRPIQPVHRIASGPFGPITIELIQPVSGQSTYTEFLARHGEGVHHIGVVLESEDAYQEALQHVTGAGHPSVQSGRRDGLSYDYMDTEPVLGTYLELVWRQSQPGGDYHPSRPWRRSLRC